MVKFPRFALYVDVFSNTRIAVFMGHPHLNLFSTYSLYHLQIKNRCSSSLASIVWTSYKKNIVEYMLVE